MRFAFDRWANPKTGKPVQSCEPRFLERSRRRALKELRGWRPYSLDYPELIRVPKSRGGGAQKGDFWVSRGGYAALLVPDGRAATLYRSRGLMPGAVAGLVVCHQSRRAFWRSIPSRGRIVRRRAPFAVVNLLLGANSASNRIEDRLQEAAQFPDASVRRHRRALKIRATNAPRVRGPRAKAQPDRQKPRLARNRLNGFLGR